MQNSTSIGDFLASYGSDINGDWLSIPEGVEKKEKNKRQARKRVAKKNAKEREVKWSTRIESHFSVVLPLQREVFTS